MRPTKWTPEKEQALILLFPLKHNIIVAEALGLGLTSVKEKARQLGLKKFPPKALREKAENVARLFNNHSFSEISKMLGISKTTIHRICRAMKLKRTEEEVKAIISHKRSELIRRERLRKEYGFAPLSCIKCERNRRKTLIRHKFKKLGYIVQPNCATIFYGDSFPRNENLETEARRWGFQFRPISVTIDNLNAT